MNGQSASVLFTREPVHQRVALRCAAGVIAMVGLIALAIHVADQIPEPAREPAVLSVGMTVFSFWIVGFFFSLGSLLCRERRPLTSALLLLFYVATATLVIVAPFRGGATRVRQSSQGLAALGS